MMQVKQKLSKIYWWCLRMFVYNKINEVIFFSKGYKKKINGQVIRVSFRFSWFYPEIYEPKKKEFIKQHCNPGDTAIDIGAHMGIFSCFLAHQVGKNGKVYSFEPTPDTYNILNKTIQYNHLGNIVDARQQAIAGNNGELMFYIFDNSRISNGNSISFTNTFGKPISTPVKSILLDSLMDEKKINNLTLIKIDAEGSELEILKGGKQLIEKLRPYITLEVHPKSFANPFEKLLELYQLITDYNYKIYDDEQVVIKNNFCTRDNYFEVTLLPNK